MLYRTMIEFYLSKICSCVSIYWEYTQHYNMVGGVKIKAISFVTVQAMIIIDVWGSMYS